MKEGGRGRHIIVYSLRLKLIVCVSNLGKIKARWPMTE